MAVQYNLSEVMVHPGENLSQVRGEERSPSRPKEGKTLYILSGEKLESKFTSY